MFLHQVGALDAVALVQGVLLWVPIAFSGIIRVLLLKGGQLDFPTLAGVL